MCVFGYTQRHVVCKVCRVRASCSPLTPHGASADVAPILPPYWPMLSLLQTRDRISPLQTELIAPRLFYRVFLALLL